jgi:uncharacterized repeat protein (TIGR04138 family)
MVFLLIEEQMFGKQDSDTLEDFEDIFDFTEAFEHPFVPRKRLASKAGRGANR